MFGSSNPKVEKIVVDNSENFLNLKTLKEKTNAIIEPTIKGMTIKNIKPFGVSENIKSANAMSIGIPKLTNPIHFMLNKMYAMRPRPQCGCIQMVRSAGRLTAAAFI